MSGCRELIEWLSSGAIVVNWGYNGIHKYTDWITKQTSTVVVESIMVLVVGSNIVVVVL